MHGSEASGTETLVETPQKKKKKKKKALGSGWVVSSCVLRRLPNTIHIVTQDDPTVREFSNGDMAR